LNYPLKDVASKMPLLISLQKNARTSQMSLDIVMQFFLSASVCGNFFQGEQFERYWGFKLTKQEGQPQRNCP
jgi:hypothetical protein